MQTFTATVAENRQITSSTHVLRFELKPFDFKAGQWTYAFADRRGFEVKKPYSIASPPNEDGLEICLNRVPGGFMSNYLCDLKPGAALKLSQPLGEFVLRPVMRDTVFVATGTGVAPFRSMLPVLFNHGTEKRIWLIFGETHEEEIIYRDYFEALAQRHRNFHYTVALSNASASWQGERGWVQGVIEKNFANAADKDIYICGLIKMVEGVRALCAQLGIPRERVYFENYV